MNPPDDEQTPPESPEEDQGSLRIVAAFVLGVSVGICLAILYMGLG